MRNFTCTTQVPNELFDELLPTLSFAELKVLLAVNRATWGWIDPRTGARVQRAWLACSRMQERTGLSKRAITNAIAALVRRRLLVVADAAGNELYDPTERRGKTRLFYSLCFPQGIPKLKRTSAFGAEVDQHRMLIRETNQGINQGTMSQSRRTTNGMSHHSHMISGYMEGALSPALWQRLQANGKRPVDRSFISNDQ